MKKLFTLITIIVLCISLSVTSFARSPIKVEGKLQDPPEEQESTSLEYTDSEINEITNVINGEVGGIGSASVILTYADGSQLYTNGFTLRMIHARIVDNQVKSNLFPSTVDSCIKQCWSWNYTSTDWKQSAQWQSCRESVVEALSGGISVPSNVYAATCDAYFSSYAQGWYLWARVDWNTGWYSGVFYYYCYGG